MATNQFQMEKSLCTEIEQVATISRQKFSFVWTVNNFEEYMNRKYEFSSALFSKKLSSGTSKWKMMIFPENIYPEGTHVAFRLLKISEIDQSYSVMYTVSFCDNNGKQHMLKTRDKVFRQLKDFDECPVVSNINIKEKCLLMGESLVIKCELDLLECESQENEVYKPCGAVCKQSNMNNKSYDGNNIPCMIQSINDLSCSKSYKSVNTEKDVNSLIKRDDFSCSLPENCENLSNKGLEILSNDLKHLYYNTNKHDVIIYVDDGKRTAHEVILTSRSDYFREVLPSLFNKEIHIPGINVMALDVVLYYLYTGKLKHDSENVAVDLMKACNILKLPHLADITETFFKSHININNVTNIFLISKEMKMESLKNNALKFIAENHEEISQTHHWNQMMKNDPHSAGEVLLTIAYYQNKLVNT